MERAAGKHILESGQAVLGIEFGSTRIKAVLIGPDLAPMAQGNHEWENRLTDGIWTYSVEDVWTGLQSAYRALRADAAKKYGAEIETLSAIGISAMMHGYLPFDGAGRQLVPFRTWRNTITGKAAAELTEMFGFQIPQRWSVAHLYQAILNDEAHTADIRFLTTLAGYVHWRLTGEKALGVGDAAGMFPIDSDTGTYDAKMEKTFDALIEKRHLPWKLEDLLPHVLSAGNFAGSLTAEGAALLDPSGTLKPGIPLAPPEGDAGTGMTATNSVAAETGNISAGTSIFSMVVLERSLKNHYPEIDMVATPTGKPVAMVHCNNCTSDLNAWVDLFQEAGEALGARVSRNEAFSALYRRALEGDADCGGVVTCGYISGEPVTGLDAGRPMAVRTPDAAFTLANFMRANLFSSMTTLRIGMDILTEKERVPIRSLVGQGGLFKTRGVAQKLMAAALRSPICCMETAGEGGPWGMALLAAYMVRRGSGESLENFLQDRVFSGAAGETAVPEERDMAGFDAYLDRYSKLLAAERAAVESL